MRTRYTKVLKGDTVKINKLRDASGKPVKVGDTIEYKGHYVYE